MSKSLVEKLARIQSKLKAPKSQYNSFGKYAYRNQEDILEAVKPLLAAEGLVQTISDEIIEVGGRIYVRATVNVTDGDASIHNAAYAREPLEQKGMNDAQITGSVSSYARKYALNGMYAIDDTKDADATNTHGKDAPANKPADKQNVEESLAKKAAADKATDKPSSGGRFKPPGKPAGVTVDPTDSNSSDDGWS